MQPPDWPPKGSISAAILAVGSRQEDKGWNYTERKRVDYRNTYFNISTGTNLELRKDLSKTP